ncbi:hypothetical protein FACS1894132_12450 [Clostridia bacterium]|nr:hypothetical protein FACS1894132_12450 [Clostridia bacterium]
MDYVSGRPISYPGITKEDRNGTIETLVRLQHAVHALKSDELPSQAAMLEYRIINNPVVKDPRVKDSMLGC